MNIGTGITIGPISAALYANKYNEVLISLSALNHGLYLDFGIEHIQIGLLGEIDDDLGTTRKPRPLFTWRKKWKIFPRKGKGFDQ